MHALITPIAMVQKNDLRRARREEALGTERVCMCVHVGKRMNTHACMHACVLCV